MTGYELAVASIAVGAGAGVQGSVGFGLNLIAAPVLALVDPTLVPGPALVMALVLTILLAVRERHAVEWDGVAWAVAGRLPGTAVGATAVAVLSPSELSIGVAVAVLVGVAITATGVRLHPTRATLIGAGALSGVMGTASSIGGPPMAMVYQRSPGATLRATLSGFFAVGALLSIGLLAVVGRFGGAEMRDAAVLLPSLLVGFAASAPLCRVLDRGHTRVAVLAVSAGSAVALLAQQLL